MGMRFRWGGRRRRRYLIVELQVEDVCDYGAGRVTTLRVLGRARREGLVAEIVIRPKIQRLRFQIVLVKRLSFCPAPLFSWEYLIVTMRDAANALEMMVVEKREAL